MKLNTKKNKNFSEVTHEGAQVRKFSDSRILRRTVMSCLLWESEFYENGEDIASRISSMIPSVAPQEVYQIALDAREKFHLRHVPLLVACEMLKYDTHRPLVGDLVSKIIQRPDELTEILSIYWRNGRCSIANQLKKGLAKAFTKFNEYSLAKYNRDGAIKLRDVLFLCHAKPENDKQADLWKRLVDGKLETPDTWEVSLSSGEDKRNTWIRLMDEKKLGGMAFLRNLRNMKESNVPMDFVKDYFQKANFSKIFPYRFMSAAKYAPDLEQELEQAMFRSIEEMPKLSGKTVILVDVSGSMSWAMSVRSDSTRQDAAAGVAVIAREICENVVIRTFGNSVHTVPSRRGFALAEKLRNRGEGTDLGGAISAMAKESYDRIIVITDEQSSTSVPNPIAKSKAYMINVASYSNGVSHGKWIGIDGFSESIMNYIHEYEKENF